MVVGESTNGWHEINIFGSVYKYWSFDYDPKQTKFPVCNMSYVENFQNWDISVFL